MKKRYLLMYLCISLPIFGAEKKLVLAKQEPFNAWKDPSSQAKNMTDQKIREVNIPDLEKEHQAKVDFLKEKVIALMDTIQKHKEDDIKNVALMKSHRDYIDLTDTTMVKLNRIAQESEAKIAEHQTEINLLQSKVKALMATVEEPRVKIERLESQPPLTMQQEEIISLMATVKVQKATIEQLLWQPYLIATIEEQRATIEHLKSQPPLTTPNQSKSKLKRSITI